jgi:hypothetical protein
MTDNLTRFLGAAILMLGVVTFILLGTSRSLKSEHKPVLAVPVFFIIAGAYIANRANS